MFNPDTIKRFDIRTSSRRTFRRCLRKWGLSSAFRDNLTRIGSETNIHFWFGSAIHFAMEDYFGYNRFKDPRRAFRAYYDAFDEADRPEGAEEHYDLGQAMLTYFLEWYPKHNQDMSFQTLWLDSDRKRAIPFSEGAKPMVEEQFTLDLGLRVIIDNKTGKILQQYKRGERAIYQQQIINDKLEYVSMHYKDIDNLPVDEVVYIVGDKADWDDESCTYDLTSNTFEYKPVRIVPVCYHGTMDRIVVDKYDRWWILDYKTAKSADTRKLDTDDQISAYMWAAEQHFQHPIYGFVYLQMTKEVAKEPRRLKDGSLSTDKSQKTTHALYKKALLEDYGSMDQVPKKYIDTLNVFAEQESAEGDRYIRWDYVTRNAAQKISTYNHIMGEAQMMINPDLYLFPNPTRDCGWDCPFREYCIMIDQGRESEAKAMLSLEFEPRDTVQEHNLDDWMERIKWPESDEELEAMDITKLVPQNIFNIVLPDKYYTDNYEED